MTTANPDPAPVTAKIKVAIVEDRSDLRKSLSLLIKECDELELTRACPNADDALEHLPGLKPDVILMDINLPGNDGIDCTRKLKTLLPKVEVMMLTVEENDDKILKALQAGASGYLVKRESMSKVLELIKAIHRGETPLSASIARKILATFKNDSTIKDPIDSLTEREVKVLSLIAEGYTNKEAAKELSIDCQTVETHLRNIYKKLKVTNRVEAAVMFMQSRGNQGR